MNKFWSYITGYVRAIDKWLLLLWLSASSASVLFLIGIHYSGLTTDSKSRVITQVIAAGIGLLAAIIISLFDYHTLLKLWRLYMPLCVAGVVLTYFIGHTRGADKAWILISMFGRTFSIQPTELLKISFITTFAMHLNYVKEHMNRISTVLLLCVHGGAHMLLVQLQGDTGTALIFVFIFLFMIFFAGISLKYIAAAVPAVAVAAPVLWYKVLTLDQKMRVLILFDSSLSEKYAFQQLRGKLALGVGGMRGTGVFSGKHIYVPEMYNDFLLSFIGESTGFIGALGVIALITAIALKIFYNSSLAKDDTGRMICVGVFAMIVAQTIINLGMCIGVMPVIGVTLPLFSSGGTSVLASYIGLGIVLSIYSHSTKGLFYENR